MTNPTSSGMASLDELTQSIMSGKDTACSTRAPDPRLERLMSARGAQTECEIEFLVLAVAKPLIDSILSRYRGARSGLARQDLDDLASTIHLRLVARLRTLSGTAEPIENFEKYVATLTYNVVHDHLRRMFPERARLKNRLRYTLTHDARLALWMCDGHLLAGLRRWSGAPGGAAEVPIAQASSSREMRRSDRSGDALVAIFEAAKTPVVFDALVSFTAALWNVSETETEEMDGIEAAAQGTGGAARYETREYLRVLWREIQALRPMQRKALLLNLRAADTVNVVSLIVLTRIARFDELAAVLEMSPEALSGIWNELPLDDRRIASMLQVTRQQVINLRKSARQRLERRMAAS